ncbi:Stringent starvation protein B [Hartmannibacter diazotrophicus]|uniref:Stringent starvation protein B n=1 Tax=Hartmannibacter diazotrophicus TaxID=1482074 RepID=A0A2C9D9K6_9HYPH|nr:SspB family protein [Hartmannibacter diazotrophicus]SON56421.1 Stringent starvation protein B [Hartmannibacter diazotrophicus]
MSDDLIRYDVLTQEALRGVVKKVLGEVARAGLPGEHHFYIALDTRAPGVRISSRLRERYPEEMTIVLQHQFWDLVVTENAFEVGLTFGGVHERLHVPFSALKGFFDPSVEFGIRFEVPVDENAEAIEDVAALPASGEASAPVAFDAARSAEKSAEAAENADGDDKSDDGKGAAVVSLDAFRKKT